jgi:hypothetical protein
MNQALFTHLFIDEEGVTAAYAAPFDVLLDPDTIAAGQAVQDDREVGLVAMAAVLSRQFVPRDNTKTSGALRAAGGLTDSAPVPHEGFGGLKMSAMAGVEGIEPPNAWTKTMCLTAWLHPKTSSFYHTVFYLFYPSSLCYVYGVRSLYSFDVVGESRSIPILLLT